MKDLGKAAADSSGQRALTRKLFVHIFIVVQAIAVALGAILPILLYL